MNSRWITPVASLIPVLACVYAFTLGPSPYKLLKDFHEAQRVEVFEGARVDQAALIPVLIQEVQQPERKPGREKLIEYLGRSKNRDALPVLGRILKDKRETQQIRSRALRAIFNIDQGLGVEEARSYQVRADALGKAAKRIAER